jgi:hypothetical protein
MPKKIYCFDLDNTLCITEGNIYEEAKPISNRIEYVNQLYAEGHTIIIETASRVVEKLVLFYIKPVKILECKFPYFKDGHKLELIFSLMTEELMIKTF